jgi:uncharacterized protein YceH (UPF0502 family)
MNDATPSAQQAAAPRWQPINAMDRRVAGVLVEKAKTVPSAYPMSLNAIVTAANQKSNRFPVMQLEPEQVEESLERLRQLGAVGLVQGYGRVSKYRHYLYEWLGVDKVELAVMAELLLRGAQTEGELRARAARMESISDLAALRPILASLTAKRLVLSLSPEGRGHVVTHALYPPRELEHLKAQYAAGAMAMAAGSDEEESAQATHAMVGPPAHAPAAASPARREGAGDSRDPLHRELEELRVQVAQLREDLNELAATLEQTDTEVRRLKDELGS